MKESMMTNFDKSKMRAWLIFFIMMSSGLLLILVGQTDVKLLKMEIGGFLANLGGSIVLLATLQMIYDQYMRSQFFDEIAATINSCQTVRESGIKYYYRDSLKIDYSYYIATSNKLIVLTVYSDRFLKDNFDGLKQRATNNKKITFIRCKKPSKAMEYLTDAGIVDDKKVSAAHTEVESFINEVGQGKVDIREINTVPRYSVVAFDTDIFLILNTSSKGRRAVPALHLQYGTPLYDFIKDDLDKLMEQA